MPEKQTFPNTKITAGDCLRASVDIAKDLGRYMVQKFTECQYVAPEDPNWNSGAAAMLDRELYDQVQVEGFVYRGEELPFEE